MNDAQPGIQPLNESGLWCQQIITDHAHGEIKVLVPVDADLNTDLTRKQRYFSTIIVNTPMGALQHEFEIPAATLREALARYVDCANQAGKDFIVGVKDAQLRNSLLGVDAQGKRAAN